MTIVRVRLSGTGCREVRGGGVFPSLGERYNESRIVRSFRLCGTGRIVASGGPPRTRRAEHLPAGTTYPSEGYLFLSSLVAGFTSPRLRNPLDR